MGGRDIFCVNTGHWSHLAGGHQMNNLSMAQSLCPFCLLNTWLLKIVQDLTGNGSPSHTNILHYNSHFTLGLTWDFLCSIPHTASRRPSITNLSNSDAGSCWRWRRPRLNSMPSGVQTEHLTWVSLDQICVNLLVSGLIWEETIFGFGHSLRVRMQLSPVLGGILYSQEVFLQWPSLKKALHNFVREEY